MAKDRSTMAGRCRITSMTEWDQDSIDAELPGYFNFAEDGLGDFQFRYVNASSTGGC